MGVSNPSCSSQSSGSLCTLLRCGVFQGTHSFAHLGVLTCKAGACPVCVAVVCVWLLCHLLCAAQGHHPAGTAGAGEYKRGGN